MQLCMGLMTEWEVLLLDEVSSALRFMHLRRERCTGADMDRSLSTLMCSSDRT